MVLSDLLPVTIKFSTMSFSFNPYPVTLIVFEPVRLYFQLVRNYENNKNGSFILEESFRRKNLNIWG